MPTLSTKKNILGPPVKVDDSPKPTRDEYKKPKKQRTGRWRGPNKGKGMGSNMAAKGPSTSRRARTVGGLAGDRGGKPGKMKFKTRPSIGKSRSKSDRQASRRAKAKETRSGWSKERKQVARGRKAERLAARKPSQGARPSRTGRASGPRPRKRPAY